MSINPSAPNATFGFAVERVVDAVSGAIVAVSGAVRALRVRTEFSGGLTIGDHPGSFLGQSRVLG